MLQDGVQVEKHPLPHRFLTLLFGYYVYVKTLDM
jgi:hypothetical protein